MWFEYSQNNSGGTFYGPLSIWVEADNPPQADDIAEVHGVYFNGCDSGLDCSCCGDRWTPAYGLGEKHVEYCSVRLLDDDGNLRPQIDILAELAEKNLLPIIWGDTGNNYLIVFADGHTLDWVMTDQDKQVAKNLALDNNSDARYGFSFYPSWTEPTEVFKAKPSSYDKSTFYASDGNRSFCYNGKSDLYINEDKIGNIIFNFSSTVESEAKQMRKLVVKELLALREAVQDTALTHLADRDIDPDLAGFLMRIYEVKK